MIVILFVAVLFISVRLVVLKPAPDLKSEFLHEQLAENFGNTLLTTTTHCDALEVVELIVDCANFPTQDNLRKQCPSPPPPPSLSKNSCQYLEEDVFPLILNRTFGKWAVGYELNITSSPASGSKQLVYLQSGCLGLVEKRAATFTPQADTGPVTIRFSTCR